MGVAESLCVAAVAALLVVFAAITFVEAAHGRADRRCAEALREFRRVAEERAARVRADRESARSLDAYTFDVAERERALARAAHSRAMPSREQVLAAAGPGAHDRLGVSDADRAAEVALLADMFRRESRPPVADTDPGAAASW